MAELDARPTEDQEVAGSTPDGSATFFRGGWLLNTFYGHSLPPLIQERQLSISGERMFTA